MTQEARLHEMIAAACLGAGSEASFTTNLRGFLESHGVDEGDIAEILAAPRRLALYRRLVRNNLTGVTEKMLGHTRARVNAVADGAFDASFSSFLDEVGPRTHYLRDVPGEFLDWIEPRWRERSVGSVPEWAIDLARHELVEFQIAAAETTGDDAPVTDLAPDRSIVFTRPLRLMRYAFAVHELPLDPDDRTEPTRRPTALLTYRDEENAVQFLELTPFAAAITRHLLDGRPVLDAVGDASAEIGASSSVLDVARFLADLGERRVILGGRA